MAGWRRTTSILSLGQLISWGALYYAFAVYLPQMREELGWSLGVLSGGFATAIVVSGLAAPLVGRRIDRVGSRTLMTSGAVVGTVGLGLWATAHNLVVYYLAFAIIGLAWSTTLYPPAFATVVRHFSSKSRKAIVTITLAGGLASTIFYPLAQLAADAGTWRTGLLILAAALALTTIPLNLALPKDTHRDPAASKPAATTQAAPTPKGLAWIAAIFMLTSGASVVFAVYIVAFLIDAGQSAALAATIAGAAGIAKVAGRATIALGARYAATTLLRACLLAQAIFLAIPLLWTDTISLLAMVLVFGATSGSLTVLRPLLITELFGTNGFATKDGKIQLATTLTRSAAPILAGVAIGASTYAATWAGLATIVALALLVSYRLHSPSVARS